MDWSPVACGSVTSLRSRWYPNFKPLIPQYLLPSCPKLKASEKKEIFPLRLSALEMKAIKHAAGDEPLAEWMRRQLLGATPEGELSELSQAAKESIKRDEVKAATQRFVENMERVNTREKQTCFQSCLGVSGRYLSVCSGPLSMLPNRFPKSFMKSPERPLCRATRTFVLELVIFALATIPAIKLKAFSFRTEILFSDWSITPDEGSVLYTLNGPPADFQLSLEANGTLNPPSQTGYAFGQDDRYLYIFKLIVMPDNLEDLGKPVGVGLSYNVETRLSQEFDYRYSWNGDQQAYLTVLNPTNAGDYIQDYQVYHAFANGEWFGDLDYWRTRFGPESLYVGPERDFAFKYGTEYTWTIYAEVSQTAMAFRDNTVPDSSSILGLFLVSAIGMVALRKLK